MILDRFEKLIDYLATCNGTGKLELDQQIQSGVVTKEDAELVLYYVNLRKLSNKLDKINVKTESI